LGSEGQENERKKMHGDGRQLSNLNSWALDAVYLSHVSCRICNVTL
jgi:hypothetical protein